MTQQPQAGEGLTFNDTVLFQEGGRARQGVRRRGRCRSASRRTRGRDVVAGGRVLAPVPIDLHVQKQFVLFDVPGGGGGGGVSADVAE